MVKTTENFKDNLKGIKDYLTEKRMIKDLASRSGVSDRQVGLTFSVKSFEELTGKKLIVYQEAIKMVDEIKNLPAMANKVIKS